MEDNILGCQVCLTKFKWISDFKKHARSRKHREKIEEIFQKDTFKGHGFFPYITVMGSKAKHDIKQPLIGLSLLTFCFSLDTKIYFYLCHVCEEKCRPDNIARHLSSSDHCSNYFNYTDPNVASFSWLPSMNMSVILRPELTKEAHERGPGQLQMLHLPGNMLEKLETSTYSEVMRTLSENEKLLELIEAVEPKRTMIQTYQRDSNRKHPLLGLQHIVECVSVGPTEKRYYLCTLCKLTLATHMVIKHVLSFDHIYCYFKAWHPSTLLSKECYKDYNKAFASMILDFAKQTEEIHGTANTDMKQVNLEPAKFNSVNFTCYSEALKELESITKEKKESSLITSIKPGKKLERPAVSATSVAFLCKLCCQDCNMIFETTAQYFKHVSQGKHKEMLEKFFVKDESDNGCDQTVWKPILGFFKYLKERSEQNQPAIGVSLVVACVSTQVQVEPIYVCFACKDCFPDSIVRQHFISRKHLINTLLYQNPWRLPFGWENRLDVKGLTSVAWKEEEERRLNQMTLKILDIPYWMFSHLTSDYPKVMELLQRHHTLLKRNVPRCETYSKLKENERFPLLGLQFLVMHDMVKQHQCPGVGFVCLLCKRRLSDEECHAHVFSREHVATFLDRFHPGSLNSSTDVETLLDLAKQAGRIHSISHVQVIKLGKPIWEPCTYHKAISILAPAKRREGKGKLEPPIMHKMKLVPRGTLKDVDKAHVSENSRVTEGSEKKTIQKSTEHSETSLTNTSVEVGVEIPTPSPKESERRKEVFPKTSSEEIKNAGSETCLRIKEEKIEEPIVRTPSGETVKSCKITDKADGTEIRKERSKSSKGVLKQLKNTTYKENKRKGSSMCEKSQDDSCPNEEVEMCHKRQRLTFKQEAYCEEPQNLPSSGQTEATTADEGESGKLSHKTAKDNVSPSVNQAQEQADQLWQYVKRKNREPVVGLTALLECCCDQHGPIYLCECCSLKITEKDIISHVTGAEHQKMYLVGLQKLPPPPGKRPEQNIRHLAALFEKANGYGEAQVVDLDEGIYNDISKQNFKSAIQTVKTLLAVEPVDTSVTHHAQHEVYSNAEDLQVVDIEVDDSDSEAQPSSVTAAVTVMTESACKTTEVPPESNEDAMMNMSDSAANAYTCPTVSTSSEDPASLHLSTRGTNTTHLHPDPRNDSKAKIISNSNVGPLKTATTSKIGGASQYGKNALKNSETASKTSTASQTMVTSVAPETIKTSVKYKNTAKTVLMKHSVGQNTDAAPSVPKSNAPAAPHLTVFMSEKKNPPTEPSHNSKPSEGPPEVGLNQLIKVSCEGRRQVYCQLCSVRLKQPSHLFSPRHQYNYVKMKFPAWTAKPSESKLDKIVAHLAEAEKDTGSRCNQIDVKIDVYEELAAIPEVKALQQVKAMLRQRDLNREVSSPTTTANERLALASPCEASSPDDAVRMEPPQGFADPLATDSESHRGSFVQTPHIHQKTAEKRQQQERSGPKLQETQKVPEGTQRTSPVPFFNRDPRTAAALVITKQQNQPRHSEKAEPVPKPLRCAPGPKHHSASQEIPSIGERTHDRSHLSFFLKVKRLNCKSVGLGFVWECHGEPPQKPFFLCESCRETIAFSHICQHMVSNEHQRKYMLMQHPQYTKFWDEKDLLPQMKLEILNDVVKLLSEQESNNKIDAQVVKLRPYVHKYVETAPFSEALQLVQDIKKEPKRSVLYLPVRAEQQTDRQPEDRQSGEESLRPENQSTQALQTDQRSDNEKHHLDETAVVGDLDGVKHRRVLRALDVTSASSKAEYKNRISPSLSADTCHSPQETCRSLSMQPELRPPASQNQRSIPELQVKQGEVHSEFPSSSVVSPETSQTLSLSPRDNCPPTRKRPAVESLETLVRPCTSNPQPEEALPAKHTRVSQQSISQLSTESTSESTPVNPAATSTLLAPKDHDTGPGTDEQDPSIVDHKKLERLMTLLREMKSDINISSPDDAKNNSPSLEGMFSTTAAPENQLTTTHVNPAFPAASSSIEGYLVRDNQAEAVGVLPSASTADPSDPQHQEVSNQSMSINVSHFIPTSFHCVANNHNSGQIPQGNTDTDSRGGGQLPIDSIITARPEPPNQHFMGGYNAQDHTEVNRCHQVAHSLPTVAKASPSDSLAALGGYGQYSQMAYVTNRHIPGYLSSEAVAGYTTPDNLSERYSRRVFYTSQIYPEQVNCFGHLATPMAPGLLESQQQQLMQRQLMQQQLMQQQLMQQQYSAWRSTALAAGGEKLTEAAYLAAALASIHCSCQQFN